jgi:peptide/nickel transport system substrate-binding protein
MSRSHLLPTSLVALVAAAAAGMFVAPAMAADDVLVFGTTEVPSGSWDPQQNFGTVPIQVNSLVFGNLIQFNAEGELVPDLATEWVRIDDNTLEVTLREGVTFHDGSTFDAGDVRATIERVANDANIAHNIFWTPAKVEVLEPHKVRIVTDAPFAPLERVLAVTNIISEEQAADPEALRVHPIGTGYFKFDSYTDSVVRLTAFNEYWNGPPGVSGVDFRVLADRNAMMAGLAAGELDITYRLSPADLDVIGSTEGISVTSFHALDNVWFGFDTTANAVSDPRVRRAIAHAINRPGIIELFGGYAKLPDSPLPIGAPGYEPLTPYDYNPELARQLLAEAGITDLTLRYPSSSGVWPFQQQVDQIIVSSLEAVGIKVEVERLDTATFFSTYPTYDIFVQSWYMLTGDPDFSFSIYGGSLGAAIFKWQDEGFAERFAKQRSNLDPVGRQADINELSKYVWEELPLLPLHNLQWIVAYSDDVVGYTHGPTFAELLHGVTLKR